MAATGVAWSAVDLVVARDDLTRSAAQFQCRHAGRGGRAHPRRSTELREKTKSSCCLLVELDDAGC
jgi:hypothetical protein